MPTTLTTQPVRFMGEPRVVETTRGTCHPVRIKR
jgi:hypothetical protein